MSQYGFENEVNYVDYFDMTPEQILTQRELELENFKQELKNTEYFQRLPEHVNKIMSIVRELEPYKMKILSHDLYKIMETAEDVQIFMECHVFAVWDFMSLLKTLQGKFTCLSAPWAPVGDPALRRMINSIVVAEESDENEDGVPMSHYEMYRLAMKQAGASTTTISHFVDHLMETHRNFSVDYISEKDDSSTSYQKLFKRTRRHSLTTYEAFRVSNLDHKYVEILPRGISQFVDLTLNLCEDINSIHRAVSGFSFGREDLICPMFLSLLRELGKKGKINTEEQFSKLHWYLERHVEVDGDDHGPLSMQMISVSCGEDERKWAEARRVAIQVIESRKILWDYVLEKILERRKERRDTPNLEGRKSIGISERLKQDLKI